MLWKNLSGNMMNNIEEEGENFYNIIDDLGEGDRRMLELRYFDKLKITDIATIFNHHPSHINNRLREIRVKIKFKLKKDKDNGYVRYSL